MTRLGHFKPSSSAEEKLKRFLEDYLSTAENLLVDAHALLLEGLLYGDNLEEILSQAESEVMS